jgi:hypothetical protein
MQRRGVVQVSVLLTQKGPLSETVELKRVGDSKNVLDWRGLLRNEFRYDKSLQGLKSTRVQLCVRQRVWLHVT